MPNVKIIPVFTFDELTDSAKEHAREWWRNGALDYEWWDSVYDDHEAVCEALGIEIDRKKRYFEGFSHQGSGASYSGVVNAYALLLAYEMGQHRRKRDPRRVGVTHVLFCFVLFCFVFNASRR